MERLTALLRSPFSFLFATKSAEERVAVYVVREHERGRDLADILDDAFVKNRLTEREVARVLERPDVIHAIGDDLAAQHRKLITGETAGFPRVPPSQS